MGEITDNILANLPWKRKNTPSGWVSFNAVCCHNNGEKADTRGRGGILHNSDDTISYHCFNCGFTASWQPGRRINFKMRRLMSWLGLADEEIRRLSLFALSQLDQNQEVKKEELKELPKFEPREACPGKSILTWLNEGFINDNIEQAIAYLDSRGLSDRLDQFYWTNDEKLSNRVLVPFTWLGKDVGYSGRLFAKGALKYLSNYPSNMIWGYDQQKKDAKFCLVVEGLLDAVSVDGIAICNNEVSDQQALMIESLDKEIIVIPDKDEPGKKLIKSAMEYGWNVAFPDWQEDIKDVADAVARYGQLFTMKTILDSVETSNLKIQLMTKRWLGT